MFTTVLHGWHNIKQPAKLDLSQASAYRNTEQQMSNKSAHPRAPQILTKHGTAGSLPYVRFFLPGPKGLTWSLRSCLTFFPRLPYITHNQTMLCYLLQSLCSLQHILPLPRKVQALLLYLSILDVDNSCNVCSSTSRDFCMNLPAPDNSSLFLHTLQLPLATEKEEPC